MSDKPQIGKRKHLRLIIEAQDGVRHGMAEVGRLEQLIMELPERSPATATEWEATAYALLRQLTAVRRQLRAAELVLEENIELIKNAPEPTEPDA